MWSSCRITARFWFYSTLFFLQLGTRVEVPEQISADQLWFRKYSVLIQCCSSPENLWRALYSSETKLMTAQCNHQPPYWGYVAQSCWIPEATNFFSKNDVFRKVSTLTLITYRWRNIFGSFCNICKSEPFCNHSSKTNYSTFIEKMLWSFKLDRPPIKSRQDWNKENAVKYGHWCA